MNLFLQLILCGLFVSSALSILDVKTRAKRHIWRGSPVAQTVQESRYAQTKGGRSNPAPLHHSTLTPQCAPHENGIKSHPSSCQMYITCTDGEVLVDTCSEGFLFNDATKECDFASEVTCLSLGQSARLLSSQHRSYDDTSHYTDSDREVISHFKCPHEGIFEHPHDCAKFIQCAHSGLYVQPCGPGTIFNPSLLVCDWPKNVNCNKNVNANIQTVTPSHKSEFPRNHEGQDRRPAGADDYDYSFDVRMSDTDSRSYNNNNNDQQRRAYSTSAVQREQTLGSNQLSKDSSQTYSRSGQRSESHYPQNGYPQTSSHSNVQYQPQRSPVHTPERSLLPPLPNNPHHTSDTTFTQQLEVYPSTSQSRTFPPHINYQASSRSSVQYPPQTSPQFTPSRSLQPPLEKQQPFDSTSLQSRSFQSEPSEQENLDIIRSVQPLATSRTPPNGNYVHSSPSYSKTKVYSSQQSNQHHQSDVYPSLSSSQGAANIVQTQPLNQQSPGNRQRSSFDHTMDLLDTYANYEPTRRFDVQNGRANVMSVDRANSNRDHEVPIYNRPERRLNLRFTPTDSDDYPTQATEHALHLNGALKLMLTPYTKNAQLKSDEVDQMTSTILVAGEAGHSSTVGDKTIQAGGTDGEIVKQEPSQNFDASNLQLDKAYDENDRNLYGAAPTPDTETFPELNSQAQTKTGRLLPGTNSLLTGDQNGKYNNRNRLPSDTAEIEIFCSSGFDCGNGVCLSSAKICDGRDDCGNRLDERNCKDISYDVRLSGDGDRPNVGRLEVKIFDKWGHICGDGLGINEANVFCREAGFPLGAVEVKVHSNSQSPVAVDDNSNYVLHELRCSGNETTLKECEFSGWDVRDCNSERTAGLVCKLPDMKCQLNYWLCDQSEECIPTAFLCDAVRDCSDGSDESPSHCNSTIDYRLGNLKSNQKEGRVEVRYKGIWGTVCDDDFGENEAKVFCRSLGYDGAAAVIKEFARPGEGPIWLDQVNCIGNETSLDKCTHFEWGENNCNHTEDVHIRCVEEEVDTHQKLTMRDPKSGFQHLNEIPHNGRSHPDHCGQIRVADHADDYDDQPVFKVIEGRKAKRGHHPWQATLRVRGRNGKSSHWCGAVLISKTHVLTAAHCLIGFTKNAYFVRFGDHHSETPEDTEVEIFIEDWYIHEKFRKGHLMNNDIALIKLKSAVKFTDHIQPICLPTEDTEYTVGKNCSISGWGSTQYGKSTPSLHLRSAYIPIMSEEVCKQAHNYGSSIQSGMFCAGLEDNMIDACDGDSGGPFVCQDDDENGYHSLYGIISWGQRCGDKNKPGVYTKVAEYLPWIHENMLL